LKSQKEISVILNYIKKEKKDIILHSKINTMLISINDYINKNYIIPGYKNFARLMNFVQIAYYIHSPWIVVKINEKTKKNENY